MTTCPRNLPQHFNGCTCVRSSSDASPAGAEQSASAIAESAVSEPSPENPYLITGTFSGDPAYVKIEIDLHMKTRVSGTTDPLDASRFRSRRELDRAMRLLGDRGLQPEPAPASEAPST